MSCNVHVVLVSTYSFVGDVDVLLSLESHALHLARVLLLLHVELLSESVVHRPDAIHRDPEVSKM